MLMAVTKKVGSMQEQMRDVSNKFKRLETEDGYGVSYLCH